MSERGDACQILHTNRVLTLRVALLMPSAITLTGLGSATHVTVHIQVERRLMIGQKTNTQ